jgi:hypothetical protein
LKDEDEEEWRKGVLGRREMRRGKTVTSWDGIAL